MEQSGTKNWGFRLMCTREYLSSCDESLLSSRLQVSFTHYTPEIKSTPMERDIIVKIKIRRIGLASNVVVVCPITRSIVPD